MNLVATGRRLLVMIETLAVSVCGIQINLCSRWIRPHIALLPMQQLECNTPVLQEIMKCFGLLRN